MEKRKCIYLDYLKGNVSKDESKVIKEGLDKKLVELSKEPSIEELMKTDYEKLLKILHEYLDMDEFSRDMSFVNYDALAMVLSALQYHVSEGGLKKVTYKIVPLNFKIEY